MSCDGCSSSDAPVKKAGTKIGMPDAKKGELSMTEEAAKYVAELLKKDSKPSSWGLKIEVVPGGCAGYKYFMAFQEKAEDDEKTFNFHGVNLFLSPDSIELLGPSTIEYIATLEASGLRVNNPNAVSTCACGKSFG